MRPVCHLMVKGSSPHHLSLDRLEALQELVLTLGAEAYPLFLRLAAGRRRSLQPVVSGALLAEIQSFSERLQGAAVPCLIFHDAAGALLGGLYAAPSRAEDQSLPRGEMVITPTPEGIRAEAALFPPPVGFRSRTGLAAGRYECYFRRIEWQEGDCLGWRTGAMGGSGAPVVLTGLHLPPATRWDFAYTNGRPAVARVDLAMIPFPEAFQEVLHGLRTACEDSLRLKAPLQVSTD